MTLRDDPFPLAAVAALLSMLRTMYRDEHVAGASPERLQEIRAIAERLREASELALAAGPGTLGYTVAWVKAESATEAFCRLADDGTRTEGARYIRRVRRLG